MHLWHFIDSQIVLRAPPFQPPSAGPDPVVVHKVPVLAAGDAHAPDPLMAHQALVLGPVDAQASDRKVVEPQALARQHHGFWTLSSSISWRRALRGSQCFSCRFRSVWWQSANMCQDLFVTFFAHPSCTLSRLPGGYGIFCLLSSPLSLFPKLCKRLIRFDRKLMCGVFGICCRLRTRCGMVRSQCC